MKGVICSAQIMKTLHKVLLANTRLITNDTILNGAYLTFLALDHVASTEKKVCEQNEGVQALSWRQDVKEVMEATCHWLFSGFIFKSNRSKTLQVSWASFLPFHCRS